ncbi:MAG: LTA synthase family protein [Clostridia bacterium]|nr:LTA synthase family protein [Clostridia bacterium]
MDSKRIQRRTGMEYALFLILFLGTLFINAVLCSYLVEIIVRQSRQITIVWYMDKRAFFWAEVMVVFCVSLFLSMCTNRPAHALRITNLLIFCPAVIYSYKWQFRGEPLLLTDFGQIREAAELVPNFKMTIPSILLSAFVILIVLIPIPYMGQRLEIRGKRRAICSAASAVFFLGSLFYAANIDFSIPNQYTDLYNKAGFLRGLWETRPQKQLEKPAEYERTQVLSLLEGFGAETVSSQTCKPDVFFIMSESLFDLYRLEKLDMTMDPLASLKKLQEEYSGANFLAPNFGGGTFYSEYEVLTGYRTSDTPNVLFNDKDVITEGMDTLVTVLKEAGYTATAVHPNSGRYYNRAYNYRRMGFDRMQFAGDGLKPITEKIGFYPKDKPLLKQVLDDYDGIKAENQPLFYHIVTYQNHGPYASDYDRRDVLVMNRSGDEKKNAENYSNACIEHMEAVAYFLQALSERKRPAVVVLWGDHAPNTSSFGLQPGDGANAALYYQTPILIWNNYGADFKLEEDSIAAYRLGAVVLNLLGIHSDAYFNWLAENDEPDLLTSRHLLEIEGRFMEDDDRYKEISDQLYLLHYDRLKGEKYWKEAN